MRLVLVLLTALPSSAQAAAFYFSDVGTRALGRGGAFIAGNDDLTALYYNPAALIRQRGPTLTVNWTAVSQYVRFDRADEPGLEFEAVTNDAPPFSIPTLGFAHDFGLPNTTFAIGFYPPYAPDVSYPEDGPQRYTLVDTLVWETFTGVSVAQRVQPWLTVGAGVNWTLMRAEQELAVAMCLAGAECGDNLEQDVHVRVEAWDRLRFLWNAGLLVEPAPWIAIGAGFLPPIEFRAKGSLVNDFGDDFYLASLLDGTEFTDEDITMIVPMPMIARLGVAVRPMEGLEFELAGVYEGWSVSDAITVTDVDVTVKTNKENPLAPPDDLTLTDDILLDTRYADAWSGRFGADWDINDRFTARLGGLVETSAVPPATQGVGLVDGFKFGYGAGGGVQVVRGLTLDVALAQTFIAEREITDSEVTLIELSVDVADPENSAIVDGKVVGNGSFESRITFLSAGLTWRFGRQDAS